MKKPILVVKFGSASITLNGEIDTSIIAEIARQIASLQPQYNIVIVSSGAVAAGKKYIPNYRGTLQERKAAAAVGNPLLLLQYTTYFEPYGIALAQSLCERHHFSSRHQFLQLKQTYETLWTNNIIPIANENDVVSNKELKFSDNDELATLIAVGFGAAQLVLCTSVPGVLDANGQVIPKIEVVDKAVLSLARNDKSSVGLGGMTSKLNFAKLATQLGIQVCIFSMQEVDGILKAVKGKTGTLFLAEKKKMSSRKMWMASGSLIRGMVIIDDGAIEALQQRKSLLAVGVIAIPTPFESGEIFHIADSSGEIFAVAKANVDASFILENSKIKNLEIAHADNIVVLL